MWNRSERASALCRILIVIALATVLAFSALISAAAVPGASEVSYAAKKISVSRSKISTTSGEYSYVHLRNANYKSVKWSSSNKKVAVVKKSGDLCEIRAKNTGKAIITAKYKKKSYKCTVTVKKKYDVVIDCLTGRDEKAFTSDTVRMKEDGENWVLWSPEDNDWVTNRLYFRNFRKIHPMTVTWAIDNTDVVKAKWQYDSVVKHAWNLYLFPKSAGETTLTITNTYNDQVLTYKVIVEGEKEPASQS